MQCAHCGRELQATVKFCPYCGQRVPALAPPAPPPVPTCVQCGQPVRPGAAFCGKCGARQPVAAPPPPVQAPAPASRPVPPAPARPRPSAAYLTRHALLIGALSLGLLIALVWAFAVEDRRAADGPPAVPTPATRPAPVIPTADPSQATVEIAVQSNGRFGLRSRTDGKLLTFDPEGDTHNTRVWVNGETPIYGDTGFFGLGANQFKERPRWVAGQSRSVWVTQGVEVAQLLSYVTGSTTGRVDTARIQYTLTNTDRTSKQVGLRILLDTLIGRNDGVPFVVPGRQGITNASVDLRGADVPDTVQALEVPDLARPGVIVQLTLQGADATRPDRVVISPWCWSNADWDTYARLGGDGRPLRRCNDARGDPDSAIALYFDPHPLGAGETRTITTYYGLGGISSEQSGNTRLSLTFNRLAQQGDMFWVTALVTRPGAGQTVHLDLPAGLAFAGSPADQPVTPSGDYTQVSWRVVANTPFNDGRITATLQPDGVKESQAISVQPRGITR